MSDNVIKVTNISKKFRLYHENRTTFFEAFCGIFDRKQYYEDLQVLNGISFELKKGEALGILGRNGSGKTTLLRILSKIYKADSGSVEINGTLVPLLALGLGFHPELTATANIYQSSTLLGFDKKEILTQVDEIIKFAELEKFADTKIKNFSQGMLMRLAFSTAVQVNPDILVLDEVVAVGDMNFQKKCFNTIKDFKKRGKSIVLVSHSIRDIENVCDRAIFLNKGNIVKIGPTEEVISEYQNFMKSQE
jgi:ABC-type polysaccharide/polyol phosphate transport system ATPase subunit